MIDIYLNDPLTDHDLRNALADVLNIETRHILITYSSDWQHRPPKGAYIVCERAELHAGDYPTQLVITPLQSFMKQFQGKDVLRLIGEFCVRTERQAITSWGVPQELLRNPFVWTLVMEPGVYRMIRVDPEILDHVEESKQGFVIRQYLN
ncbi:MAG: hypothetical protein GYB68_07615 [Chloroflexi bacterium]|nr:hypothetical protein [Chloroflexota bacterium]